MKSPHSDFDSFREPGTIWDQAACWLGEVDGGLTPDREAAFRAWLDADPRHAAEYARLERVSRSLDVVMQSDGAPGADSEEPLAFPQRRPWRRPAILAAAAMLAMAASLWWEPGQTNPVEPAHEIAESSGTEIRTLPDGSTVELNTDSSIEVVFTPARRGIRLVRGEAYFTVVKDPSRPFVVSAGEVAVRAVGTAFNVRIHEESIEVLVTDGVVDVDNARVDYATGAQVRGAAPLLRAGHRAVIAHPRAIGKILVPSMVIEPVAAEEISRRLSWQHRTIEFGPGPLSDLVEEFNRHNSTKIVIADPAIADLSLGGLFRTDDRETLLRLLDSNFQIHSERRGNIVFLRQR